MKTLGLIANCGKERAPAVLRRIADVAARLGLDLCADPQTGRFLPGAAAMETARMCTRVEAIIALGGDGTMLRAVREIDGREVPVMGINIGGLGFLTSVADRDLDPALACLASDDYRVQTAMVAEAAVIRDGVVLERYRGLNDVVITRSSSSRVATLRVSIDGEEVTSYLCDGIIVSTPVGSTGHSLSAGGPILSPRTRALLVNLICPHTLSSRPLIVPDSQAIDIESAACAQEMALSVDGQVGRPLLAGDSVRVRRSGRGVRLLHLPGYRYFSVLRQKLGWRGSNV
jgi:NAD+ kinase